MAPWSAQKPIGSALPAGRLAHVPSLPLTPQLGHDVEPQQNPSTQLPVAHWRSVMQLAPMSNLATQPPLLQNAPAAHWSSFEQLPRQLASPQAYGLQLWVPAWAHAPVPLQCDTGWYVDPEHETAAPQTSVAAPCWQPPPPLQAPVLPHGGLAAHWPGGAVTPAPMLAHIPGLPARLHARHVPQLAALQQTPSTQLALVHSRPPPHASPSPCLATQLLPLQ
jgi:hypothetical protein